MRRIMVQILTVFMIAICSNGMAQLSESIIDKKVGLNGGFEYVENNMPLNWLVYTERTVRSGDFTVSVDKHTFQSGRQSLHFDVKQCSNVGGRYSPGMAQEIKAHVGGTYKISYWIKNMNSEFVVKISGVNAFNKDSGPTNRSSESNDVWKKYEHTYTVAKQMKTIRFEFNVLQPGLIWIDDVIIEKI